jgi:pyrroloquinoline quinone biosynthesis protein E
VPAPPLALLAELTHRCPLRCAYCSNPTALTAREAELPLSVWQRVIGEAAALGVHHLHLSGGEPLLYEGLEALVRGARDAELYTNLITSAWGLDEGRVASLAAAGLDHVQVSFQDTDRAEAKQIAGVDAFDAKHRAARLVKEAGLALSVNVVLHRGNVGRVGELIDLAVDAGADRIEVASTQYHGWALQNREALLPSLPALAEVGAIVRDRRRVHGAKIDILYVLPDYATDTPKPCMDGWGRRSMTVAPDGRVLPCPGATCITTLAFERVQDEGLSEIWARSPSFEAFRGESWMREPCATCDRRSIDYGGCRCQAFTLTGDDRATDPACAKAPDHPIVLRARAEAEKKSVLPLVYRELRR